VVGTTSAYTVKKLFFFTFPLASLLWVNWLATSGIGASLWERGLGRLGGYRSWVTGAATLLLGGVGGFQLLAGDLKRPGPEPGHDPVQVARRLALRRAALGLSYYHDPKYPLGAYFASVTGLHLNRDQGLSCWETFRSQQVSIGTLVREVRISN